MAGDSKAAVYGAIAANSLVMVAKFAGFLFTGSGTMLAEGIHSAADVGNQTLLAVGMKRSQLPPDAEHPFGYGRDAFIWSLMSAVGIFFIGCGVTIAHGVHTLVAGAEHEVGNPALNLGILVLALVAEGASLYVAVRAIAKDARAAERRFWDHVRQTDDPFTVAVLLEDSAAVLGVVIAFVTIGLGALTHEPYWDGIGSIVIGFLLGAVALFLMQKNRSMLIGRSISPKDRAKLVAVLESDPAVEHVVLARATVAGADTYRISAEIELDGHHLAKVWLQDKDVGALLESIEDPEALRIFLGEFGDDIVEMVGDEVDRIEARIRRVITRAQNVDIEPD
jgi:zinc transporter 9